MNLVNKYPNLYDKYETIKKRSPLEIKLIKIKTGRLLTMRKRLETRRMNHEKSIVMKQLKDEKVKSLQSAIETKNKEEENA